VPEIRVDPLSGYKTIVAGERSRRPGGEPRCVPPDPIDVEADPFAEGHEDRTPPELYALRPGGGPRNSPGWTVRVVPNLFPALAPAPPQRDPAVSSPSTPPSIPTHSTPDRPSSTPEREVHRGDARRTPSAHADARPDLFTAMPATGAHEVIVNAPQSVYSLAELPLGQVMAAVEVWRERMRAHAQCAYTQLIVNERREAGASLPHTHAQLYALDFVPADVARERERAGAYATRTMGHDLLGDLIAEEVRRGERIVAIDDEAVLMAPYGSRVPFQLMLAPRSARARFEEEGPTGAALLHDGLRRLARHLGSSPPLNLWVRTAPRGAERFCWRIDVLPRLTHLAGLELSTGVNLNIVAPEDAAALLREA
jgi:UDPglucose--hexose-1-phosphate uridylyltransferase